jgi:hypothetical protein
MDDSVRRGVAVPVRSKSALLVASPPRRRYSKDLNVGDKSAGASRRGYLGQGDCHAARSENGLLFVSACEIRASRLVKTETPHSIL